jgi:RodZ C-terminal domain
VLAAAGVAAAYALDSSHFDGKTASTRPAAVHHTAQNAGSRTQVIGGAAVAVNAAASAAPTAGATRAPTTASPPVGTAAVDLRISARAGDSWIELRRGSEKGRILYVGVLRAGHGLHFQAPRVWASLGAAGNLAITVNGAPVALRGTLDKLFVPDSATAEIRARILRPGS